MDKLKVKIINNFCDDQRKLSTKWTDFEKKINTFCDKNKVVDVSIIQIGFLQYNAIILYKIEE